MLYVKGMLFFDGAIAELAPDLDMFAEVVRIYGYFAENHAETIASQIGFNPAESDVDLTGMKTTLGLEEDVESITHRELLKRREVVQKKFEDYDGELPKL
jgi:hypothetical protein